MYCTVCGEYGNLDHFLIHDGEVLCRPSLERDGVNVDSLFDKDMDPFWFGGTTNEEGEVYGG